MDIHDLMKLPVVKESRANNHERQLSSLPESISGKHISDEEIDAVNGHYRLVAESLMEVHALKTKVKTQGRRAALATAMKLLHIIADRE